ncbi:RNase P subunit p30, partial [Dillenia turbinata]
VDIIAIDFAKLPFRMKLPMIKAAIGLCSLFFVLCSLFKFMNVRVLILPVVFRRMFEFGIVQRGIYFEIVYSPLIMEAERRQTISDAKFRRASLHNRKTVNELLMDWTPGKNLIISSAAPSVNKLRGPNDVANLFIYFLLGLSIECAKAALSKNCRALISHTLRKKHYYKEAIRIELFPSHKPRNSTNNGMLTLVHGIPSPVVKILLQLKIVRTLMVFRSKIGFQVKDYISRSDVLSQLPAKSTAGKSEPLPTVETVATAPMEEDFNISKKLDACTGPSQGAVQILEAVNSVSDGEANLVLLEDRATIPTEEDVNNSKALELPMNHALSEDKVAISMSLEDIGFAPTNNAPSELNSSDTFEDSIHLASSDEDLKMPSSFSMSVNMINVAGAESNAKDGDAMYVLLEPCTMSLANPMRGEVRNCSGHAALLVLGEEICLSEANNEVVNSLAVADEELEKLKEQEKEKLNESFFPVLGGCKRGRGSMPHHSFTFPARHLLNPVFFKRRARKFRAKTKIL